MATSNSLDMLKVLTQLVGEVTWPACFVIFMFVFKEKLHDLASAIAKSVDAGAEVKLGPHLSIGSRPSMLEAAKPSEPVTSNHLALIHSSWRYSKKDAEFNRRMYCFHVILQGKPETLDRVESVKYILLEWFNKTQVVTDRASNFKLKELAWGEGKITAQVFIKGQADPVILERYINLTETGPRI